MFPKLSRAGNAWVPIQKPVWWLAFLSQKGILLARHFGWIAFWIKTGYGTLVITPAVFPCWRPVCLCCWSEFRLWAAGDGGGRLAGAHHPPLAAPGRGGRVAAPETDGQEQGVWVRHHRDPIYIEMTRLCWSTWYRGNSMEEIKQTLWGSWWTWQVWVLSFYER